MPHFEIFRATPSHSQPLARMLELYQHDLSDIWDQDLDAAGEFGYDLSKYWRKPACEAHIFLVAGKYAGFALLDDSVRLAGDQIWLAQFFVMKKYRKQGLGAWAAKRLFEQVPGRWEVGQMPGNDSATRFWRRVIGDFTKGEFVEHCLDDARWHGYLHCFDSPVGRVDASVQDLLHQEQMR